MSVKRGYYSIVQFVPNPSRAEAVNMGVALFCPDAGFLQVQMSAGNKAAAKLVGREAVDPVALNAAKKAIEYRLQSDRHEFQTLDDFQHFTSTRANALKLTPPRPMVVGDPLRELDRLFQELVGGGVRHGGAKAHWPALDELFQRLAREGRAQRNITVTVPIAQRLLHVPYAYRNGDLNLVKPQVFSAHEAAAIDVAMRLAVEGDLLLRHGEDEQGAKRLVILPAYEPVDDAQAAKGRVNDILAAYRVKTIHEEQIGEFVAQVEQEAH